MTKNKNIVLLQGNEACALGALRAGASFFAGYPITPSTEIAEVMARELPKVGGKFIQMEDEIAGMAAIIGASLVGKKVLTATSGPGFSLKQENLGFAALTEIPCVVVNVMRGGPSTGLPTSPSQGDVMQAKWGTHGDHPVIALCPSSVQECYELTVRAFNLAEKYMTPVIILMDETIGHLREALDYNKLADLEIIDRKKPEVTPEKYQAYAGGKDGIPTLAPFGTGYRYHVTGLIHDEGGYPTMVPKTVEKMTQRIVHKISAHEEDIIRYESLHMEDADIVIFAYGGSARSAKEGMIRLRQEGWKVGLFRPITIWPFPEKVIKELAGQVQAFVVPEMNMGQLKLEVERAVCGQSKVLGVNKMDGHLVTPEEIMAAVKEVLS